jgi:hypothetical protein
MPGANPSSESPAGATAATPASAAAPETPATTAPASSAAPETSDIVEEQQQPETPAQQQADDVDDIDAEYEEFAKSQGEDGATQAKKEDPQAGDNADEPDADAADLSDTDREAIKRHGLDPDDITTLRNLTPDSRKRWIANLDKRAKFTDDVQKQNHELQQQLRELQGKKPGDGDNADDQQGKDARADQQQRPAAPAEFDAAWKGVEESFEPFGFGEAVKPIRGAIESMGQSITKGVQQQMAPIFARLMNDDIAAGFDKLELPEGVDKNDPKVREAIKKEADTLLSGSFDINNFNYRHAIERAGVNIYQSKIQQAEKARKDRERRASLRGTAEPSVRTPGVAPKLSDDDFEDAALDAVLKGDSRRLEQITA